MAEFPLPFAKMSGTGNDFILIDNRKRLIGDDEMVDFTVNVCRRSRSVGADGVILIQDDSEFDFSWRFFNSDGSEAEMCGNGSRCAARFALMKGIAPASMTFRTLAGPIRADVNGSVVRVQLTPPFDLNEVVELKLNDGTEITVGYVNTGVPHTVIITPDGELGDAPVQELGREIRGHLQFSPAGTNVNFAEVVGNETIRMRTYERGVEAETLACGTGAVAVAIICTLRGLVKPPVTVITRSEEQLKVFVDSADPMGEDVFMEGTALQVYEGQLSNETAQGG
ncbi:MAG: diaminopimelate epimerase [bacterium]